MASLSFVAKIKDGRIIPVKGFDFSSLLEEYDGMEVKISFENLTSKSSTAQFGLLYGYIYPSVKERLEEMGYDDITIERVDYMFKELYALKESVNVLTGEVTKRIMSKSEFSKIDMKDFIDKILKFCAENLDLVLEIESENTKV
jgi:hypothetical protein